MAADSHDVAAAPAALHEPLPRRHRPRPRAARRPSSSWAAGSAPRAPSPPPCAWLVDAGRPGARAGQRVLARLPRRAASATRSRPGWSSRCSASSSAASSRASSPAGCARTVEKGPRDLDRRPLRAGAFVGGALMGIGAKLARGCTSGQALTGGALLNRRELGLHDDGLRRRLRRRLVREEAVAMSAPFFKFGAVRRRGLADRRLRDRHRLRLLPRARRLRQRAEAHRRSST